MKPPKSAPDPIVVAPDPPVLVPHPGDRKLGRILAWVVAGFFLSLAFHYELGNLLQQPYPLSTFLFRPVDQFNDYYSNFYQAVTTFAAAPSDRRLTPGWGSAVIMVRSWLMDLFFYSEDLQLSRADLRVPALNGPFILWLTAQAVFLYGLFYFVRKTVRQVSPGCVWGKTLALTLCSYPVLFCLDRSNFENTIFLLLGAALILYQRKEFLWSALLLGLVIALKPYGVVFLAIFLSDRRFKEIFISLGLTALLTLAALLILPGGMSQSLQILHDSMSAYTTLYVQGNEGLYFGSSLYGMAKVWLFATHTFLQGADYRAAMAVIQHFMFGYFLFAAAFYGLVVILVCSLRVEYWKKVALMVCCMNMLPYICGDYRLIHLFMPLIFFLLDPEPKWGDGLFCVLFGLLLVPFGYIHFTFDPAFHLHPYEVSDSVVIRPLLMLALCLFIALSVLRRPVISDTGNWVLGLFRRG